MLLNENFRVQTTGSRTWRRGAFVLLAFLGMVLSLVTLQPAKSEDNTAENTGTNITNKYTQTTLTRSYAVAVPIDPASLKSKPLADAIKELNEQAQKNEIGKKQSPLTEDEVIGAILFNKDKIKQVKTSQTQPLSGDEIFEIYETITKTRILPPGARLDCFSGWAGLNGYDFDGWAINLNVMTKLNYYHGFRIREVILKSHDAAWLQGKEAQELAEKYKPIWGTEQKGLQLGICQMTEAKKFKAGEHIPLKYFIRNTSDKEIVFGYQPLMQTREHLTHVESNNKNVQVFRQATEFTTHLETGVLKPGEMIALRHFGVGIGKIEIDKCDYIKDPSPAKYSLREQMSIKLEANRPNQPLESMELQSGKIDFEVVAAQAANDKQEEKAGGESKPRD